MKLGIHLFTTAGQVCLKISYFHHGHAVSEQVRDGSMLPSTQSYFHCESIKMLVPALIADG